MSPNPNSWVPQNPDVYWQGNCKTVSSCINEFGGVFGSRSCKTKCYILSIPWKLKCTQFSIQNGFLNICNAKSDGISYLLQVMHPWDVGNLHSRKPWIMKEREFVSDRSNVGNAMNSVYHRLWPFPANRISDLVRDDGCFRTMVVKRKYQCAWYDLTTHINVKRAC